MLRVGAHGCVWFTLLLSAPADANSLKGRFGKGRVLGDRRQFEAGEMEKIATCPFRPDIRNGEKPHESHDRHGLAGVINHAA